MSNLAGHQAALRFSISDARNDSRGTVVQYGEAHWYVASGSLIIGIGLLTRAQLRATGTLPVSFGWSMLVSSTILSLMMPVTGMWAVVAQSLIAILLSQRDAARDVSRAPA